MGGASRLILLLSTPFTLVHPRRSTLLRHFRLVPLSTSPHHLTSRLILVKSSQPLHTQTNPNHFSSPSPRPTHPWPEWSKLVNTLSTCGYFQPHQIATDDDAANEGLSEEFDRAAKACLAFARDRPDALRWLSKRDAEVIVENGTPFLFKGAFHIARRMRSFLSVSGTMGLESDTANMVDLMKYLLSYASNPTGSTTSNSMYNRELVESSVRSLLNELAEMSCRVAASNLSAPEQYQVSGRYAETPRPLGQNIEIKRGDWICQKCSFMNFARNIKCLECDESRPKRQLTGGEWECPQCSFFNYGRNKVCLRCDCKRPEEASLGNVNSRTGLGYNSTNYSNKADTDSRLAENDEKAQQWFIKVSQLSSVSDINSAASDEDFPEIMPLRKGVNRFVVSTRKTPLDRRLSNSQYKRNSSNDGTHEGDDFQNGDVNKVLDSSISRSLDRILGRESTIPETADKNITAGENTGKASSTQFSRSGSPQYGHPKGSNSNYVPFVPLPADMFAEKPQSSTMEGSQKVVAESCESVPSQSHDQRVPLAEDDESRKARETFQMSEKPAIKVESQDKEKEQAAKSETWFKKIAELHDVPDLTSAISDDDFPEIMPMRKGENRFVVSKKKDRSLTSPMYKKQMAMEQGNNSKFVPFVPFPPDYFGKKEQQLQSSTDLNVNCSNEGSLSITQDRLAEESDGAKGRAADINPVQIRENHQANSGNLNRPQTGGNPTQILRSQTSGTDGWSSRYPGKENTSQFTTPNSGNPPHDFSTSRTISNNSLGYSGKDGSQTRGARSANPTSNISSSQTVNNGNRFSGSENTFQTANLARSPSQPPENENVRIGWKGKSLEGSAVKEPNPLDMSEEAKAERWFKRVAQIKDISELSQIPDEDFPSIMPMRKGVNRFVVSKRKTPLERRLTSAQHRRNLPIVSSEPAKKENDSSS
ncbi:hypothetical protein RJ640_000745 [Escallonia rubra]|uniref:RanBP2-type domain-containing protein n=1 Tax=Escallonia rubra TaxID=112253 RepID=A0AA88UAA5_9ASTE|nr:hypothetical protein RJ640_000745 [Escallonia rubra]